MDNEPPYWRRSSACAAADCVEVAWASGTVMVRNSSAPAGSMVSYSREEWQAFVAGVKQGEFDQPWGRP